MKSHRSGTNWAWLRSLLETNLQRQPGFKKNFRLQDRLETLGQGMFNRNYLIEVAGKALVLRLAKVEPGLQTRKEGVMRLRAEAKTLQALERLGFPYSTPKFVCLVEDGVEGTVGLIESAVDGLPLKLFSNQNEPDRLLKIIAKVAVAVHKLPKSEFSHLKDRVDGREHVMEQLEALSRSIFDEFEQAAQARDWILSQLPESRSAVVLHGDLLPQNLLLDDVDRSRVSIVDWQEAIIGDPAYDLAVVTRGVRKPLGVQHGLEQLVDLYNETAEQKLPVNAVVVHELLFHLSWLSDAMKTQPKRVGGHAPEHYAELLGGILRRAALRETGTAEGRFAHDK